MNRNANILSGQAPVIHYMPYMFELVSAGLDMHQQVSLHMEERGCCLAWDTNEQIILDLNNIDIALNLPTL